MPCQALLVTTRTYSRHFESLYPVWWNWGFAPSENKIAKTINLQWSYSIHQRFLFHLLYFLCLCIYLYACFLFLLACGNGTSVLKTVLRGCLLLWEYSSILFKRRDFVFVFGYMHPLPRDCVLLHHLAPKVGRVCHLEICTFTHLAEMCTST